MNKKARFLSYLVSLAAVVAAGGVAQAQPKPASNARIFFWGNSAASFIEARGATRNTNVGVPLRAMARAAGLSGCEEGSFTPTLHPTMLADRAFPPAAELDFNMQLGRSCGAEDWPSANFNVGVIMDNNFSYTSRSWGDAKAAVRRINQAKGVEPGLRRWFLYAYQADMGERSFASWKSTHQPAFIRAQHRLQDRINAADRTISLRLVPIASVLWGLVKDGGLLADFSMKELFVDDAPHPTESTAILKGAVAFSAFYRRPIPVNYRLPAYANARLRSRWPQVRQYIWSRMNAKDLAPRVFGTRGGVITPEPEIKSVVAKPSREEVRPVKLDSKPKAPKDTVQPKKAPQAPKPAPEPQAKPAPVSSQPEPKVAATQPAPAPEQNGSSCRCAKAAGSSGWTILLAGFLMAGLFSGRSLRKPTARSEAEPSEGW